MCPLLPDPTDATLFVNGRRVGSQATYICNAGFVPRPGDVIVRSCQANGEWTGVEPQCIRRSTPFCVSMLYQFMFNISLCESWWRMHRYFTLMFIVKENQDSIVHSLSRPIMKLYIVSSLFLA